MSDIFEPKYSIVPTTDNRWRGLWRVIDTRGGCPRIVTADSPFKVVNGCLDATGKKPYSYVPVIEDDA